MKTLLLIHSCQSANEAVRRHWPFYKNAGCDIVGVGRVNSDCRWPEAVPFVNIGLDQHVVGDNLCRRIVDTFRWCLASDMCQEYSDFCVIEYDTIILDTLPKHPGGLWTNKAVQGMNGYKANQGFHCPWWADRETARWIVSRGDLMLKEGDIEHGSPDLFLGRLCDRFDVKWTHMGNLVFSRNTLDNPGYIEMARKAIREGAIFVHGCKTEKQLEELMA